MIALLTSVIAQANEVTGTLDHSTPIQNWQVITAFLLPLVMAVIIQSHWSRGLQAAATMIVSLVVTFGARALTDQELVVPQVVIQALELFAMAIPFYYGLWKPAGTTNAIEAKTTIRH